MDAGPDNWWRRESRAFLRHSENRLYLFNTEISEEGFRILKGNEYEKRNMSYTNCRYAAGLELSGGHR
jgi:hypothetical protein